MNEISEGIGTGITTGNLNSSNINEGFSSRGFSDFKPESSKGIIDINHGREMKSSFARSEGLENLSKSTQPFFNKENPIHDYPEKPFEPKKDPKSQETKLQSLFGPKVENPHQINSDNRMNNSLLQNTAILWEKPREEEKSSISPNREEVNDKKQAYSFNSIIHLEDKTKQPDLRDTESLLIQPEKSKNLSNSSLSVHDSKVEFESNKVKTADVERVNPTKPANHYNEPRIKIEANPEVKHSSQQENKYESAKKSVLKVKEAVRLMPESKTAIITLPKIETSVVKDRQNQPQILTETALEELVETQILTSTQTEFEARNTIETKLEQDTVLEKAKTDEKPVPNQEKTITMQEINEDKPKKEQKIRIEKAWFTKDIKTNKNRRWEVFKAYIWVNYKWMRQYISSLDGVEVAKAIKNTREREKMESVSIKRLENDGSVNPYADSMKQAEKLNDLNDLQSFVENAEEKFTATEFTQKPTSEIVDGDKILHVHNEKELFEANLDGEIVSVNAKGAHNMKKPEFIRVEIVS